MEEKLVEQGAKIVGENSDEIVGAAAKIASKTKNAGVAIGFGLGIAAFGLYYKVVKPVAKKIIGKISKSDDQVVDESEETTEDSEE